MLPSTSRARSHPGFWLALGALFIIVCGGTVLLLNTFPNLHQDSSQTTLPDEGLAVTLYFWNESENAFLQRGILVNKKASTYDQVRQVINSMNLGGETNRKVSLWPFSFTLRSVYFLENATCVLDFEKTVAYNLNAGTEEEIRFLYSVVYTLASNFPDKIKQVKFLIGGQEAETLAGHIDISEPLRVEDFKKN